MNLTCNLFDFGEIIIGINFIWMNKQKLIVLQNNKS